MWFNFCNFSRHSVTTPANSLHGTESLLQSQQLLSNSRNSQHFMECEGASPCSQEATAAICPESDDSSTRTPPTLLFQGGLFPSVFVQKPCIRTPLPCMLHALHISSSLTWSFWWSLVGSTSYEARPPLCSFLQPPMVSSCLVDCNQIKPWHIIWFVIITALITIPN